MYSYVCKKCGDVFSTRKNGQKFCCKSCANSFTSTQRARIEKSLYENGLNNINAYILGIIFTDGCLSYDNHSGRYRVTIAMKDKEFIDTLRRIIAPDKKLYNQLTWAGTMSYSVLTRNEFDIRYLRNLGITERKSNVLKFPGIPELYLWDFIRGVFDGDGCVYISNIHKGKKYVAVSFTSGSEQFLNKLERILLSNNIHCTRSTDTRKDTYYLKIYTLRDIQRFYSLIYDDPVLYLERKKSVFDDNDIVRPV